MNPEAQTREAMLRWITEGRRFATAVLVEVAGLGPARPWRDDAHRRQRRDRGLGHRWLRRGSAGRGGPARARRRRGRGQDLRHLGRAGRRRRPDVWRHRAHPRLRGHRGRRAALVAALLAEAERPAGGHRHAAGRRQRRRAGCPWSRTTSRASSASPTSWTARSAARRSGCSARGVTMIRRYGGDGSTMGDDLRVFVLSYAHPGAPDRVRRDRLLRRASPGWPATSATASRSSTRAGRSCERPLRRRPRARFRVARPLPRGVELGARDVVLVFTHDAKFDEPALLGALRSDAGYIGALGSRKTQDRRRERLLRGGPDAGGRRPHRRAVRARHRRRLPHRDRDLRAWRGHRGPERPRRRAAGRRLGADSAQLRAERS